MNSNRPTGFQHLVYVLASPKVIVFAAILAFAGGYIFQSRAFVQLILVPIGICVAIVLLDITIAIATRIVGVVINPGYRRRMAQNFRAAWKGDRR